MTSAPVAAPKDTSPAPLPRGARVLVRARNLLRGVNAWRRGQERVFAIPATVDVVLGGGNYFLRSELIPEGFTAHRSTLEVAEEHPDGP